MTAARTVLEVPVPEADSLALLVRRALNPDRVVPDLIGGAVFAHVSILGPLPPPVEIDDSTWAALASTCSRLEAFSFTLAGLRVFGGGIAYLVPEPDGHFRDLMRTFSEVVFARSDVPAERATPHLTLAIGMESSERLAALDALVRPALPLTAHARHVDAVFVEPSRKTLIRRFPLRG